MASRKTTTKKKAGRSPQASSRSRAATTRKKAASGGRAATAGKKTARSATKKVTKKRVTKKVAGKVTKKKVTKKKVAKKTATKVAKTTTKVAKKTTTSPSTKKTAARSKAATTKTGKKTASGARGRRRGQTVAEAASTASADSKGYVFIKGRRVRMISTKGQPVTKKTSVNRTAVETKNDETKSKRPIKTKLPKKDLDHFRELLLHMRSELIGDLKAMENEALRSSGGAVSHMPIHMADIGTDTYDQDFMLGMAETERRRLREIDEALQRIEDRTYGICQMTGKSIPKARLNAKPWAKYTIEAARELEGQLGI